MLTLRLFPLFLFLDLGGRALPSQLLLNQYIPAEGAPSVLQLLLRFLTSSLRAYLKDSEVKSLSGVWLCDPTDCSLPGSSIHGLFQARVPEWVAISFSRGIFLTEGSNPGLQHCRQTLYHLSYKGSSNETKSIGNKRKNRQMGLYQKEKTPMYQRKQQKKDNLQNGRKKNLQIRHLVRVS